VALLFFAQYVYHAKNIKGMIQVMKFVFNEFQENTYVLFDETGECIIIDPGCYKVQEQQVLSSFILTNNLKPVKLINTHCHIDHVLGNAFVAGRWNLELYLHQEELFTYNSTSSWASMFGMVLDSIPEKQIYITEDDEISFGNSKLSIAFTPGHSIASLCFYNLEQNLCIAGDVLFAGSIGRTDLPGGDYDTLIRSIKTKLLVWPDEMRIYPGHGHETNIGAERTANPFLQ
jgi:glyoxylase-like metal-dependent hydrolase (beta-lactamase superfamily II)